MTQHGLNELWRISKEIDKQKQVVEQGEKELKQLEEQSRKGEKNEVPSELPNADQTPCG